ncbi:MAG: PepSY-associated TM helix domain-containing protein [Hyphomonadaceae bacterium]
MSKSIWPKAPSGFVAAALSGHAALGLALGALLYIVCLSGTLAVFYNEIERWEDPSVPEMSAMTPEAAGRTAANALAMLEETPHHFGVRLPTPDMPRTVVFAEGRVLAADAEGVIVAEPRRAFETFLLNLHIYLHLPGVVGLTFVGFLGAHAGRPDHFRTAGASAIFRDAFTMRFGGSKRLGEADLHNRMSVWAAPFHLVIAVTGALIGLSSVLALFVAVLAYNGDVTKVFEPIFGPDQEMTDETPAPMADIPAAYTNLKSAHPEVHPYYVSMHDPATKAQTLSINALYPRRLAYSELYAFDVDGTLRGSQGMVDGPVGRQAFAASYTLHFGSFGGLPIRLAYGVLGVALCMVVATGLNIWFIKRRERGRPAPRLQRSWTAVVWGAPASLSLSLLAAGLGVSGAGLIAVFWASLALAIAWAVVAASNTLVSRALRLATGALIALALTHYAVRYGEFLMTDASIWTSLALLLAAIAFLVAPVRSLFVRRVAPSPAPAE